MVKKSEKNRENYQQNRGKKNRENYQQNRGKSELSLS